MEVLSNLPPGVTESTLSGNTPDDVSDQEAWDGLEKTMLSDQDEHDLTGEECLIIWQVGLLHILSERKTSAHGTVQKTPTEH